MGENFRTKLEYDINRSNMTVSSFCNSVLNL